MKVLKDEGNRNQVRPMFALNALMLMTAFCTVMIGSQMPAIQEQYHLTYSQIGVISAAQSLGGILSLLAGTFFLHRIEPGRISAFLGGLLGVFCVCVGLLSSMPVLAITLLVFGACQQCLMVTITQGVEQIAPEQPEISVQRVHFYYGIGSILAPVIASYLVTHWGLLRGLEIAGGICLGVALLTRFFTRTERTLRQSGTAYADRNHDIQGMLPVCIFAVGLMGFLALISGWLSLFLHAKTMEAWVGSTLTAFWLGTALIRLPALQRFRRKWKYAFVLKPLLVIILIAVAAFSKAGLLWVILMGVCGLLTGEYLPLLMSKLNEWYGSRAGNANSLMMLAGTVGSICISGLAGMVTTYAGADGILYLMAGMLALMSLSGIGLNRRGV